MFNLFLIVLVVRSPLQVRSFYFLYKSANFLQLSAELLLATIAFFVKYISAALYLLEIILRFCLVTYNASTMTVFRDIF
jgi:hypothetical protein